MAKKIILYFIGLIGVFVAVYIFIHSVTAGLVTNFTVQLGSQVIASAANQTISFTISSDFGPDETLELFFQNDFDLTNIDYSDIDFKVNNSNFSLNDIPGEGSGSPIGAIINGQTIIFTQNDTDTIIAGSTVTVLIGTNADYETAGLQQIYNPTVAGTYKISLSGSFGDMGTVSVAILESDSVSLKAEIAPYLSFYLRNDSDTANINSCDLGTITNFAISQCSYRLAVETNANNGFQVYIKSDGNFRSSSNYISNISENSQVSQGFEGYGISVSAGNNISKEGDFSDDDTPISDVNSLLISTNLVYNYIEGDLNTSTLITHKASVSSQTKPGIYSQQIVYSVLANF